MRESMISILVKKSEYERIWSVLPAFPGRIRETAHWSREALSEVWTGEPCVFLTCTDEGIAFAKQFAASPGEELPPSVIAWRDPSLGELPLPVIAWRDPRLEEEIGPQDLFGAPFLCENPADVDVELIRKAWCRSRGIPLVIGETKRLRLREIGVGDIPLLYQQTGGEINAFGLHRQQLSREEFADYWSAYVRMMYPFYDYGLYLLEAEGQAVGIAGLQNPDETLRDLAWVPVEAVGQSVAQISPEGEGRGREPYPAEQFTVEIAYWIFPEFRRQGYATEAVRFLIGYADGVLGAEEIASYISAENEASRRVAEASGMHLTGTNPAFCMEKWTF